MKRLIINTIKKIGLYSLYKSINRSFNFNYTIKVNKKSFKTLYLYGSVCKVQEDWMSQTLQIIFGIKRGSILDVGMNLGQTLLEIKSIDPNRPYVGLEPNPSCILYVEELVRVNKLKHCKILPIGLFTEDTLLNLDFYEDNITSSGGSIIRDFWSYKNWHVHRSVIVPVYRFDTVRNFLGISNFDIIKIDVEGAELEVLQTLNDEIQKSKPIIIIEILSAYSEKNILRFERQKLIEQLVKELNYRIIMIIGDKKGRLKHIEKIDTFDVHSNPNNCNYIFYHQNDEDNIEHVFGSYFL